MQATLTPPGASDTDRTLAFGALSLDLDGYVVTVAGRDVPVTYSEFILLKVFTQNAYRVLERGALMEALRESSPSVDRTADDLRQIDRHISRLRKKLRAAGYDCIRTMRFAGYRFVPIEAD